MAGQAATTPARTADLAEKYQDILDHPPAISAARLREKVAQRDVMDQHFTLTSLGFSSGVMRRGVLDDRLRMLVLIGQFTIGKDHGHLEDVLRVALAGVVTPREALESIQQCLIYGGETVLQPALDVFTRVAGELGVLDQLGGDQLPLDAREGERDLAAERAGWDAESVGHPRLAELLDKFGWQGISTGIRFRGVHHLKILQHWEQLDEEFAGLWETFAYRNMYSRDVLDGKARVLCTIGDLVVVGAPTSAKEHMRSALKEGATPREIMEIILMSGVNYGFPKMTMFLRTLLELLADEGRLEEVGNPQAHPYDAAKK